MKVSDLAAELEVPASTILEHCQRFGIEAAWAGAELAEPDASRIREEFVPEEISVAAMSPSAVGSMPEIVDELTASSGDPTGTIDLDQPRPPGGFRTAVDVAGLASDVAGAGSRPASPTRRKFDRHAITAMVALVLGAASLAVSNNIDNIPAIAALWVVATVAFIGALVAGLRGRHHVIMRSNRFTGLWVATLAVVLAAAGLVGVVGATWVAVRSEPAADAPLSIGELSAVQQVRWGYHRAQMVRQNGWVQRAKVPGTCWRETVQERYLDDRPPERVEIGARQEDCRADHPYEVIDGFSLDRLVDAPYPGVAALLVEAKKVCSGALAKATAAAAGDGQAVNLMAEYPTENGWSQADHDVTCVAITPNRSSQLLNED